MSSGVKHTDDILCLISPFQMTDQEEMEMIFQLSKDKMRQCKLWNKTRNGLLEL